MTTTRSSLAALITICALSTTTTRVLAIEGTMRPVEKKVQTVQTNNAMFREEVREATKSATRPGELRDESQRLNKARMASNSAARQLYRSERAELHGERIDRRFAFYAERLQNIAARIQTRIDANKAAGKDVTAAQASLDAGRTLLTTAIADGKVAVQMFQSITVTTWGTQQPEIKAAIDQAMKARLEFANARKSMMEAVAKL